MIIERTANEIIVRLSPSLDVEELQRVLNYLAYKEATANSLAVQKDVDALVTDIKKGVWKRSQKRFGK